MTDLFASVEVVPADRVDRYIAEMQAELRALDAEHATLIDEAVELEAELAAPGRFSVEEAHVSAAVEIAAATLETAKRQADAIVSVAAQSAVARTLGRASALSAPAAIDPRSGLDDDAAVIVDLRSRMVDAQRPPTDATPSVIEPNPYDAAPRIINGAVRSNHIPSSATEPVALTEPLTQTHPAPWPPPAAPITEQTSWPPPIGLEMSTPSSSAYARTEQVHTVTAAQVTTMTSVLPTVTEHELTHLFPEQPQSADDAYSQFWNRPETTEVALERPPLVSLDVLLPVLALLLIMAVALTWIG